METANRSGRAATAAALLWLLGGCTWIELTEAGARVEQASPDDVQDCTMVGTVTATTQDRVLLKRGRAKVAEELIVLARNEAAQLGGDALVPASPPEEGRQDFNVYRCGDA